MKSEKITNLSESILLLTEEPLKLKDKLFVKFDDPPGSSPMRFVLPAHNVESEKDALQQQLKDKVTVLEIGGVYSGAYTGESYAIIWFALGGIAGGILGALGQDLWNLIKSSSKKLFNMNRAKRNLLEVVLELEEFDVILHYESRNPEEIPQMLEEADSILKELSQACIDSKEMFDKTKTIELRRNPKELKYICIRYEGRKFNKYIDTKKKDNNK